MSRLATFIRHNTEAILSEWESFARTLPMGGSMDVAALRDHAKEMLEVIAADLEASQTDRQQLHKGHGKSDARAEAGPTPTAAQSHGAGRAQSGFSIAQMVSEFRALRASVIRLWTAEPREDGIQDQRDMIRFNEAIDQAIAESITRYTSDIAESKERFLAILAHDLRTPLGAVMTATGFMLETGELPEPHLTLVTRIASSSRRMNQMVTDLLDYTRTRFGDSIPIIRGDIDMRKVVHEVVSEIAVSYPDSALQVESSGDLRGHWDGDRLTQALINLVANAVQHGTKKSPIRISARGTQDEVAVSVHNQGTVIPRRQLTRIFEAMKEARADGIRDRRHLGLGLYIVEKIVTAHAGTIDVHSSKEKGTTFTVHLPRAHADP